MHGKVFAFSINGENDTCSDIYNSLACLRVCASNCCIFGPTDGVDEKKFLDGSYAWRMIHNFWSLRSEQQKHQNAEK